MIWRPRDLATTTPSGSPVILINCFEFWRCGPHSIMLSCSNAPHRDRASQAPGVAVVDRRCEVGSPMSKHCGKTFPAMGRIPIDDRWVARSVRPFHAMRLPSTVWYHYRRLRIEWEAPSCMP